MKRKLAFMCAMALLIPIFIIKIPWYLLILICWIDEKAKKTYREFEDEVFEFENEEEFNKKIDDLKI